MTTTRIFVLLTVGFAFGGGFGWRAHKFFGEPVVVVKPQPVDRMSDLCGGEADWICRDWRCEYDAKPAPGVLKI